MHADYESNHFSARALRDNFNCFELSFVLISRANTKRIMVLSKGEKNSVLNKTLFTPASDIGQNL